MNDAANIAYAAQAKNGGALIHLVNSLFGPIQVRMHAVLFCHDRLQFVLRMKREVPLAP